jgi:hypothetical protein
MQSSFLQCIQKLCTCTIIEVIFSKFYIHREALPVIKTPIILNLESMRKKVELIFKN